MKIAQKICALLICVTLIFQYTIAVPSANVFLAPPVARKIVDLHIQLSHRHNLIESLKTSKKVKDFVKILNQLGEINAIDGLIVSKLIVLVANVMLLTAKSLAVALT